MRDVTDLHFGRYLVMLYQSLTVPTLNVYVTCTLSCTYVMQATCRAIDNVIFEAVLICVKFLDGLYIMQPPKLT